MSKYAVSFDFDDTLSNESVQDYAKYLMENVDVKVFVVTSRFSCVEMKNLWEKENNLTLGFEWNDNKDLWDVVDKLGIDHKNVIFTDYNWKVSFFSGDDRFIWHLDDNRSEIKRINKLGSMVGIMCDGNWKTKCQRLIRKNI